LGIYLALYIDGLKNKYSLGIEENQKIFFHSCNHVSLGEDSR